jgi:hypothetical protein
MPFEKKMAAGKAVSGNATRAILEAKKDVERCKGSVDAAFFAAEPDNLQREVSRSVSLWQIYSGISGQVSLPDTLLSIEKLRQGRYCTRPL